MSATSACDALYVCTAPGVHCVEAGQAVHCVHAVHCVPAVHCVHALHLE